MSFNRHREAALAAVAIQSSSNALDLDCFAALAMTRSAAIEDAMGKPRCSS
jgi:hypothetical protein